MREAALSAGKAGGALLGARASGAAQPVNPEEAGGAPPTISTVASRAQG